MEVIMTLEACPTCTTEISTNTKSCPKCGESVNRWYTSTPWTVFWVVAVMPVGVYALFKRGNKKTAWLFVALMILSVIAKSSKAEKVEELRAPLFNEYGAIHQKHMTPQIKQIVDYVDEEKLIRYNLTTMQGLTEKQANGVMQYVVSEMSACWKNNFLGTANDTDIEKVIDAYTTKKIQFLNKKVPALNEARSNCLGNTDKYISERIDYLIANS